MPNKILEAALEYSKRGWRVFPLSGKKPAVEKWPNVATTDETTIKLWWHDFPKANIGIACGTGSGIFVVDVDGDTGALSLLDLETIRGPLPETYEVKTSRGRHLYFIQPLGQLTKNQASGNLGIQIDVRGDGGYVVAPPSIHPDTNEPYTVTKDLIPAHPPSWLLNSVLREKQKLEGHRVPKQITEGGRDNQLTKIAGQLRWLGLETEEMVRALLEVNIQRCRPPLEEKDVIRIAKSIALKDPGRISATGQVNDAEFNVINAEEVEAAPITWRWPGFLPRGAVVTWSGDPGQGKSTVAYTLASAISLGSSMPGDPGHEKYKPANVLILSAEDDFKKTIKPRLMVAGADMKRIKIISSLLTDKKPISFPSHLVQLTELIRSSEAELVIIDPLDAFLGEDVDSHKNADVRRVLMPFTAIAENTGAVILIISHLNKSSQSAAMYRVSGSIAFIAAARAAFVFGQSEENPEEHLFACLKNNLSRKPKAMKYKIEETNLAGLGTVSYITWCGESDSETATSILSMPVNGNGESRLERDEIKDFLLEELKSGPRAARDIERMASGLCGKRTLMTAKSELKIQSIRSEGKWIWALPGQAIQKRLLNDDESEI